MPTRKIADLSQQECRDPDHSFRALPAKGSWPKNEAPSPAARFPGDADGWKDAVEYVARKVAGQR